jgi:membrane fusion protein (multidrug efflux system)
VKKGQVLVELANVEQQADLNNARAQLEVDKSSFDRYNELFQKGFSPKAKVEEAQAALNRSQAQVDGMRSRISDRTIRAPFDGVVGLRTASPGMLATPGAAIATLDDTSVIKLDFDVPEAQLSKMKKNAPLAAKTAAFPDAEFEGRVDEVDSRINPSTRTVRVRALLPNQSGRLKPGMLMTVEVRSNPVSALAVPEIALLEEANETFVYTLAKKGPIATAERVKITPGRRRNGMIEVLGGLKPGDTIVVNGVSRIRPGQAVRINDPKRAADGKETAGPATSQPRGRI